MAVKIASIRHNTFVEVNNISQDSFSPFGTVIENPVPSLVPSAQITKLPPNTVQANQGSALKYLDITLMRDYYGSAPSKRKATAVMNMFVCAPRELLPAEQKGLEGLFPVDILERHPYTTQTFIPLGLSKSDARNARYLVIVAPSLEPSPADESLPVPYGTASGDQLPGRGLPDLTKVKAFIANGAQAVTYGAGTW
jgi:ureidoglycolate lyase